MAGSEPFLKRDYRGVMIPKGLTCFRLVMGESDLFVCTSGNYMAEVRAVLSELRGDLEAYISTHLQFGMSFRPVPVEESAPPIVKDMAKAAEVFSVGPMASVAGAVAQYVGVGLLEYSDQVIVENGGDVFLAGGTTRRVLILGGEGVPPVEIGIEDAPRGVGLCTSSATVGPSVSLGIADAVTVLAPTATLADAAASYIGNQIKSADDIEEALSEASRREEVLGVVIIAGGSMGVWGRIEIY